ncbi:MAG TPA: TM0106 family RecB-like putative nuclease [Candidatus Sulfotelmatobacter sp.]|nr:TM0106 family RecB-like putative nuclease [Candidatus Sulfotelmatobacter sp.]
MKSVSGEFGLSASDLSNHLACRHLTSLDLAVAIGARPTPTWHSPDLWVLQKRGLEHESAYVAHLAAQGLFVVDLRDVSEEEASREVGAAMEKGVDIIVQPTLASGRWFGRADVLRRVERASRLGAWSYEVYDCKLALETKAATILQLSLYSECVGGIQGECPEYMHVVPPSNDFSSEPYRVFDYAAYYRHIKKRLERAIENDARVAASYPEPTPHCSICRWWPECDTQRRKDDHLSLVAGISNLQRKQLHEWDINAMGTLAVLPVPLERRPAHGSAGGYVRVREQARVQVAGRTQEKPIHEILELNKEHGLFLLPEPSPGDMFFDLEGDPFIDRGGREYLFGFVADEGTGNLAHVSQSAVNAEEEKRAFEWFVDLVMARWAQHPTMHVYHFTGYESGALKRLMGRYASREDEIDRMLRAFLLVDLHTVVKRAVRASVEQYSLKALEAFYGFQRKVPLEDARAAMRQVQHSLELGEAAQIDEPLRGTIISYNADDCHSTRALRDWLESERRKLEGAGHPIPRPKPPDGAPPQALDERQQRAAALAATLRTSVPEEPDERSDEQSALWLLSHLLDWHRRELKSDWWEFYRLGELSDDELLDERSALAGLRFVERLGIQRNIPTDRYDFEKQETDVRIGDEMCAKKEKIGEVVAIDLAARSVDIKKTKKTAEVHPYAVYVKDIGPGTDVLADALYRIGAWVGANGMDAPGSYRAARDLLLRRSPCLADGSRDLVLAGEATVDAARRLGAMLDHSLLAIQGPPGAGKTFTGARMICELVRQGKRVGITATSHKVISNLLREVVKAAGEEGLADDLKCVQKVKKEDKPEQDPPHIQTTVDNKETLAAFLGGAHILAGTQWLWAQADYCEAVDVLFVDEAGQMSLANVLVVSQAAKSAVLLGDPQQLEQPLRGSHPEGTELSALEHLLAGAKTIPPERGLFLERTWRLHPKLTEFTSEAFYEGRLQSRAGLENQRIEGHAWLGESGLWYVPAEHHGNQNASPEEVEIVAGLVGSLTQPAVRWVDDKGNGRTLQLTDILIVAPYNAQVSDLCLRLPNARIGTVDKFQGQQAPVVIYSMTTSSPEDAPRGMEFLYSLNRLNVATSRAQAMVIVVASPRLLEPECHTPRQMQLANALCRYVELAQTARL